jgi:Ca2+-binding RTX toxin-like protein
MGTYNDANPNGLDMTGWNTVFFDGFNGTQLDWTKWPITYGGSMYWNNAFWWDGAQNSVGNGELTIGMDKMDNGIWSVGGLSTMPYQGAPAGYGHSFTYGRVEIRAKTSVEVEGAGPCFLLWPSDNSWPPEVDILETPKGGGGMFTVHYPGPGGGEEGRGYDSQFFDIDYSQWHTYTLDWLPGRLTLYVDGVKVAETTKDVPTIPMSVGLQGHVGNEWDGWYGNPNDTGINSVDISVDWVRVSQYTGDPPVQPDPRLPEPPKPDPKPGLVLTGTSGADELKGGSLGDSLSGGGGNDRLSGLGGADTLLGGEGRDTLLGGAGDDVLSGGAGNDALRGDGGNDLITTGAGVDRVLWGTGAGADRVSDFALGTDRVQLVGVAAEAVTAKLATVGGVAGLQLALGSGETLFLEGVGAATARQLGLSGSFAAGSVVPAPPGVINGTSGEDWLKGGTGADTLNGGAGSDDLQGLGGNDVLRGGAGDDGLTGGAGVDTFVFGRGDGADWVVDFQAGVEKVRLEGIGAGSVVQTLESRWGMAGLELDFGNGDEMFLQGVTAKLATSDFVFA